MVDGIWLAVELYSLIYASKRSLTDEIEVSGPCVFEEKENTQYCIS
jgi:hypothetical protein